MVIEQSNMEAKRFTGYSQGRRQVFRTGGSKIVPTFSSLPSSFLLLFLVGHRGRGWGLRTPLASAAPDYSYEMQVCKSHIIT